MAQHHTHDGHDHPHKSGCGHKEVQHGDHTDYLHDGHLHHVHDDHVDECAVGPGRNEPRGLHARARLRRARQDPCSRLGLWP